MNAKENGKSIDLPETRRSIVDNFSWVADHGGVVINAGSTIGGKPGHDIDVVIILQEPDPDAIFPIFVRSIESMEEVIKMADKRGPAFSFPRVAWQDFMSEIRRVHEPDRREPLGIHFLWYASLEELFATEPRGLALGLASGEVLTGDHRLADRAKVCCPDSETCRLWSGLDNILDPLRLIANPGIEKSSLFPTIGHGIERFVIWDVLAEKIRHKRGFELVTREDIKVELNCSTDLIRSILGRARQMRDEPGIISRNDVLELGQDIVGNWKSIRGLK